ncbi:MarR family winged helix-turn-helix transcriptional regulator [Nocardiopsis changdeensis]|uniref:MarR family winged helix-turn-helix transcriptional regulator n=1 Tax=Nocardiopsis changdeensis TaxID=2831969 RepID=UPI003F482B7E
MENPAWLDDGEQRVWRSFLRVNARIYDELERDLRGRGGLGLIEYGILVHLSEAPGRRMRMRALADSVIVSKSRLSHQIARLERDGLVGKEECTDDRRGLWAVLTDEGARLLAEVAPGHAARVRALMFDRLGPLGTAELEGLLAALEPDGDAPAAAGRRSGVQRATVGDG